MASDEIGKGGDLISREQAIGAVGDERIEPLPGSEGDIAYNEAVHDCIVALRALPSLPSVAPDPIEAEYREAAVAWAEARYAMQCGCEDFCPHEAASIKAGIRFSAARAARDAR